MPGDSVFVPHLGIRSLLLLAALKALATGLTIGSGGSGGVFGPSVFIGGMLGGRSGNSSTRGSRPRQSTRRHSPWWAWGFFAASRSVR